MDTSLSFSIAAMIAGAQAAGKDSDYPPFRTLEWKCLGPATMGGRVVDLAVDPGKRAIFYVASASGGVFKTTNGGTRFRAIFDGQGSLSIGAIALAPSRPEVVWVGTGEANPRNSVSFGDGVYRSEDGGETFTHCGLEDSHHVGGIAVHPTDPEVVFVAAMGRTWGESPIRGLYRSSNAGKDWERVLFVDEKTGCIDVRIDPSRPEVVYAATWERKRDEFDGSDPAVQTGKGSGLWRSLDGGGSWERLTSGLPTRAQGRIGLEIFEKDPRTIFAIIATEQTGEDAEDDTAPWLGISSDGEETPEGYRLRTVTTGSPAEIAGLARDDVILSVDHQPVRGMKDITAALQGHGAQDVIEIVYEREENTKATSVKLLPRPVARRLATSAPMQGGQGANAQSAQGSAGFETGGVFRSDDRGTTWTRLNSINPRPFYYSQIRVDPHTTDVLYVLGISLHRSCDGGRSFQPSAPMVHPDHHALWIDPQDSDHLLLGNDGGLYVTFDGCKSWEMLDNLPIGQFYNVACDQRQPYFVYGGLQDNGTFCGPSSVRRQSGVHNIDWVQINGGDGFHVAVDPTDADVVYSESQHGFLSRLDRRTGVSVAVRPRGSHRFNWNTPFFLSPHNPRTLYVAGEQVFKSINRGDRYETISPDITRTDRGSATALAESSKVAGLLYVGTDDGELFLSIDDGRQWESIYRNLPGVPGTRYVSDIEPSRHGADVVYVTLDGHRSDDDAPYVFRSEDRGQTFKAIVDGLPRVPVRAIVEDPRNRHLLFVGTERGCYASIDGGDHWYLVRLSMPAVAVHDLVIQETERDLIAATHGRGIYVLDIAPLQQMNARVLGSSAHLFEVAPVRRLRELQGPSGYSTRRFVPEAPPTHAQIYYHLREDLGQDVWVTIKDVLGQTLIQLPGGKDKGLNRVEWNLVRPALRAARGIFAEPGDYRVEIEVGEKTCAARLTVLPDPAEEPDGSAGAPRQY